MTTNPWKCRFCSRASDPGDLGDLYRIVCTMAKGEGAAARGGQRENAASVKRLRQRATNDRERCSPQRVLRKCVCAAYVEGWAGVCD